MDGTPKQGPVRGLPPRALRFGARLAIAGALLVALLFRIIALGHVPGLNGDEAWYGVLAQQIAAGGDPHWRTPTGNLPGPFQLGGLLILQTVFPPSFALLRIPSLLSSLAAAGLAWWIMRRYFGRDAGLIALILAATLPITIAYARFGWDPSHVPMIGLLCAGLALSGRRLACALAFAVAIAAHPTNIFLGPFLLVLLFAGKVEGMGWRRALGWAVPAALLLVLALGVLSLTTSGGQASTDPSRIAARLIDPRQWAVFALLLGRLLSGDTVYAYISGAGFGAGHRLVDALTMLLLIAVVAAGLRSLLRRPFGKEAGIVAGWFASLLTFFLIAGPDALTPHLERYAMCLIAPTLLAMTVLVREIGGRQDRMPLAVVGTALAGLLLLAGFERHYLRAIDETGSLSHRAFWTGPVEPKEAALRAVLAGPHDRRLPIRLVAEDWWLYWPVAYLASGKPVTVIDGSTLPAGALPPDLHWLVFAGGPLDRRLAVTPGAVPDQTISGTGRAALLRLWRTDTVSPAAPPRRDPPSGR